MIKLFLLLSIFAIAACSDNNSSDIHLSVPNETTEKPTLDSPKIANYVGTDSCQSCHEKQHNLWHNSDHDLAMQPATNNTVFGDFNNTQHNYYGTVSTFFKRDGDFYVNTDGPDGKLHDYKIDYTFGYYPLQQYLIRFPKGKIQALNVVWDSRNTDEGGQKWVHLYPNEHVKYNDELHWTGVNQNWNFMCADCHSTDLKKNYDMATGEYHTSWFEIDVGCEACHGPGSDHVAWAEADENKDPVAASYGANKGFALRFNRLQSDDWVFNADSPTAQLKPGRETQNQLNTCAQCHSRRATRFPGAKPDSNYHDYFRQALLTEPLYHPDGQIRGEVYVYGSFIQSKMHDAGVTCSNCHDAHSTKRFVDSNALCAQCHLPSAFDTPEHHFHKADSTGAQCVNCHMPDQYYMVVDARRDHSFQSPRPDLSALYNVPNACNQCHTDKTSAWAADFLKEKIGEPEPHPFAHALLAGQHGLDNAEQRLLNLLMDNTQPALVRATGASLLPAYLSQQSAPTLQAIANSEDPLMAQGVASGLTGIQSNYRAAFAVPLLYDEHRDVRAQAASALVGISLDAYPQEVRDKYTQALEEYLQSERFNADRPESLTNLAGYHQRTGNTEKAEQLYYQAITLAPYYTPAYINLADFYRQAGNETNVSQILQRALDNVRDTAVIEHALGLQKIRQHQLDNALTHLQAAADSASATDRFKYVYAIALNSAGKTQQALGYLEQTQQQFPANKDILQALVSLYRDQGNIEKAQKYERLLFQ